MKNSEKVFELLTQHGLCMSRSKFEQMRKIAEGAQRLVADRRHTHLLLLDSLARAEDWVSYCNYATSLVLRFYDKAPWAWAAVAYGLRQQGHPQEATRVARVGMEICPHAEETQMEMCRALCIQSEYELAKKYHDSIVQESEVLAAAIEVDPDFQDFRRWLAVEG